MGSRWRAGGPTCWPLPSFQLPKPISGMSRPSLRRIVEKGMVRVVAERESCRGSGGGLGEETRSKTGRRASETSGPMLPACFRRPPRGQAIDLRKGLGPDVRADTRSLPFCSLDRDVGAKTTLISREDFWRGLACSSYSPSGTGAAPFHALACERGIARRGARGPSSTRGVRRHKPAVGQGSRRWLDHSRRGWLPEENFLGQTGWQAR
jgi:hypothetical protein